MVVFVADELADQIPFALIFYSKLQQFSMNPGSTPEWIDLGHIYYKLLYVRI